MGHPEECRANEFLMTEVGQLRSSLYPWASDEAWRRERLHRYLHWRAHGEQPSFNLVGSWTAPDLQRELERWQSYQARRLGEDEVLQLLNDELEDRFHRTWQDALEEGTSPLLAKVNMPIWSEETGSLLPQTLGSLRIFAAEEHGCGLGWSYSYGSPETRQKATLIIFDAGLTNLADGLEDPRLRKQFDAAWIDLLAILQANGDRLVPGTTQGPSGETLIDSQGRQLLFGSVYAEVQDSSGSIRGEALSIRGFRRSFLEVRYTRRGLDRAEEGRHPGLDRINEALADFVGHYS